MTSLFFFFFNDTATTEIYTLSLHDALPICFKKALKNEKIQDKIEYIEFFQCDKEWEKDSENIKKGKKLQIRSEEHTSELQSRQYLVCRLLLEKKKNKHS